MGKSIAIFNQKGGVGKTTTNINLSAALAKLGKKVLVIDIDAQGNTTSGLGIEKNGLVNTIYDIIIDPESKPHEAVRNTKTENLFIIPSSSALSGAEVELVSIEGREKKLKRIIDELDTSFDYIFIDCPPSLGLLTINALTAVDSVIIPIQCEFYALEGVSQLVNTISLVQNGLNNDLKIEGVLLSMFDGRTLLSQSVVEEVKAHFKNKVYKTVIPRNVRLAEAPSYGIHILDYDKNSTGAIAYRQFAEEFLKRQEGNKE